MRDLIKYRLERATEFLLASKIMLENNCCKDSINRSYYAIFTTIRALLAENEIDFKKHSAVISYFRQYYIKTEIFNIKFPKYVGVAFEIRNNCDYEDFYIVSSEDAETQYNNAVEFYETVKSFLESKKDAE